MSLPIHRLLFATTALTVVLLGATNGVSAASLTLTAGDTWADGGVGDTGGAAANDDVDVDTFLLTINNDGINNDGSGLNTFNIGDITDTNTGAVGTGSVFITPTGSAADLNVIINSASVAGNITIDDFGNDVSVTFNGNVTTGTGLIVGTGNANTVEAIFDTTAGGDIAVSGTLAGDAGSDSNVLITGTADRVSSDAAWTALNFLTVDTGMTFAAGANVTSEDIILESGSTLETSGGAVIDANIAGSSGAETINITGADTLGQLGNLIELLGGDDTVSFTGAGTIDADTLDGGTGTDSITVNGADAVINADVLGFESITIETANNLTLSGDVDGGTITLDVTGSGLIVNAPGKNIDSDIVGTSGTGEVQTVTLTDGTVSGNISLGDGDDILNADGAALTGNIDMGAGALDQILMTSDLALAGTVANAEFIDVGGAANTLTVSGAITGGGAVYGAEGIDINGGTLAFNDGGSFDGSIFDTFGGALVNFGADSGGGTFTLGGEIDDVDMTVTSGTVNTAGFDLGANGAMSNLFVDGAGILEIDGGTIADFGGDLDNAGSILITAGSELHAATQTPDTGTFIFEIDSAAAGGAGRLTLTGDPLRLTGATIEAQVGIGNLIDGDAILVADGNATIIGGPGAVLTAITDNSFLWDFEMVDGTFGAIGGTDAELYLVASAANTIAGLASTPNNARVGTALQGLTASADPDIQAILAELNAAVDAVAFNDVLESALPVVDGAMTVMQDFSNSALEIVEDVLADARTGGSNSGVATGNVGKGNRTWIQAFGQLSEQELRDSVPGYKAKIYGVTAGWDTSNIGSDTIVGLGLGYGKGRVDSDAATNARTDINSYQLTLYGSRDFSNDAFINMQASYAFNNIDTVRNGNVYGDYNAYQYGVRAKLGRDYGLGNGLSITPALLGNWVHIDPQDYTETGPGALTVRGASVDIAELGLGFESKWELHGNDGSITVPRFNMAYRYDLVGDAVQTTSSFVADLAGTNFTTTGMTPDRGTVNMGLGLSHIMTSGMTLGFDYDYAFKGDYDAHSGIARVGYQFQP